MPSHESQIELELILATRGYDIVAELGRGAFGSVYRVVDENHRQYAVKVLYSRDNKDATERCFKHEVCAHHAVKDHPNVLGFEGYFEEHALYCILLEYCAGGNLYHYIRETSTYWRDSAAIKHVFLQLVDAVQHCHGKGVAHRDLKPENILSDGKSNFFVADFGLARESCEKKSKGFGTGTKPYMSPECLRQYAGEDSYDMHASDIWSLGIILVEMITGTIPWMCATYSNPAYAAFLGQPSAYFESWLPISPSSSPFSCASSIPTPTRASR